VRCRYQNGVISGVAHSMVAWRAGRKARCTRTAPAPAANDGTSQRSDETIAGVPFARRHSSNRNNGASGANDAFDNSPATKSNADSQRRSPAYAANDATTKNNDSVSLRFATHDTDSTRKGCATHSAVAARAIVRSTPNADNAFGISSTASANISHCTRWYGSGFEGSAAPVNASTACDSGMYAPWYGTVNASTAPAAPFTTKGLSVV
jgi:hypothetical protein